MVSIFISYASRHRDLTAKFAAALKAEGYDVWWDLTQSLSTLSEVLIASNGQPTPWRLLKKV